MTPNLTPEKLRDAAYECRREGLHILAERIEECAAAWEADIEAAEWKRAFDEGEVVGMRSNATDTENPYPEGSNKFCGWSFGFWQSADRRRLEVADRLAEAARAYAADFIDLKNDLLEEDVLGDALWAALADFEEARHA